VGEARNYFFSSGLDSLTEAGVWTDGALLLEVAPP
jgi:hypothetical protein